MGLNHQAAALGACVRVCGGSGAEGKGAAEHARSVRNVFSRGCRCAAGHLCGARRHSVTARELPTSSPCTRCLLQSGPPQSLCRGSRGTAAPAAGARHPPASVTNARLLLRGSLLLVLTRGARSQVRPLLASEAPHHGPLLCVQPTPAARTGEARGTRGTRHGGWLPQRWRGEGAWSGAVVV